MKKGFVINFTVDIPGLSFIEKLKNKHSEVISMNYLSGANISKASEIDNDSAVYVIVHGSGNDYLSSGSEIEWSCYEFSEILVSLLKHLQHGEDLMPKLNISLITCFGAMPINDSLFESIASKLQLILLQNDLSVKIHARQSMVTIGGITGKKTTTHLKYNAQMMYYFDRFWEKDQKNLYQTKIDQIKKSGVHKQPGSKITFSLAQSRGIFYQVAIDSYQYKRSGDLKTCIIEKRDFRNVTVPQDSKKSLNPNNLMVEQRRKNYKQQKKVEVFLNGLKELIAEIGEKPEMTELAAMSQYYKDLIRAIENENSRAIPTSCPSNCLEIHEAALQLLDSLEDRELFFKIN